MNKIRTYSFKEIDCCSMCGAAESKLLGLRLNRSQGMQPKKVGGIAVSLKQCLNCDLIFSDPQPIPASILDHYGMPPESYWKPEAFNRSPQYFAKEIETAKRLISFRPGMTALDIGAGLGKAMLALADAGFETYGIEPSPPFREKAISQMGVPAERLQLATIEDASFSDDTFDFITFGAVLEHLYDPAHAIEKSMAWLKPGGILQAEVPSSRWLMSRLINRYFRLRGTNLVTNLSPMHSPFHIHEFGLKSFQEHAKTTGYTVAEHSFQVCSIHHVPGIIKPVLRTIMAQTGTGMQLTVWLRKSAA